MGAMWIDAEEDPGVYPMQGLPTPPFDDTMLTKATDFPEGRWGADFKSLLWLIDFTRTPDWQNLVRKNILKPPKPDSQDMKDGLKELVIFQQTLRESAMPEILAQRGDFHYYLCSQLAIYPRSYPHSYQMLKNAARIGELVMVGLKRRFRAVRPSQIYPRLTPPIPVPGHASYPSGHATISFLMARMAKEIVPDLGDAAYRLAQRITRNREIAGLHFWWDSIAGEIAALNTFDIIETLPNYAAYLKDATDEWTY
jgi:hypothetical protein